MNRHRIAAIIVIPLLLLGIEASPRSVESTNSALPATKQALKMALEMYRFDLGVYPTKEEGLQALIANPGFESWKGPYIEVEDSQPPPDPWGHEFRYMLADGKPQIDSAGPDGTFGTMDDNGNNMARTKGCTRFR